MVLVNVFPLSERGPDFFAGESGIALLFHGLEDQCVALPVHFGRKLVTLAILGCFFFADSVGPGVGSFASIAHRRGCYFQSCALQSID